MQFWYKNPPSWNWIASAVEPREHLGWNHRSASLQLFSTMTAVVPFCEVVLMFRIPTLIALLAFLITPNVPAQEQVREGTGRDGRPLLRPALPDETQARLTADYEAALARFRAVPSEENIIWLGRRLAYLGRYKEAIDVFTQGITAYPDSARLHRHRGHRYITLRKNVAAIADLERAARLIRGTNDIVEPDGAPNAYGMPRSTLHSNIWYHLGLVYYLTGNNHEALAAFRECEKVSRVNDDSRVAAAYWLALILWRLDQPVDAAQVYNAIRPNMQVIENHAYHDLLLLFRGLRKLEDILPAQGGLAFATTAYGVSQWHAHHGRDDQASALRQQILDSNAWASFGYIAAEADAVRTH